jgi:hypothetical protein
MRVGGDEGTGEGAEAESEDEEGDEDFGADELEEDVGGDFETGGC